MSSYEITVYLHDGSCLNMGELILMKILIFPQPDPQENEGRHHQLISAATMSSFNGWSESLCAYIVMMYSDTLT